MRRYETIFIVDPELSDSERGEVIEKATDLITREGGYIADVDEWGARKLAYEIRKKKRGYYVLVDYCAEGQFIAEFERVMRIDDRYLKYLTVQLADNVNLEVLKKELAALAAEKEEAARLAEEERQKREEQRLQAAMDSSDQESEEGEDAGQDVGYDEAYSEDSYDEDQETRSEE